MKFIEKLENRMDKAQSLLCVGLDPDLTKIPERFLNTRNPLYAFSKWIVDETHEYVCAFKPNSAFFESSGAKGINSLKQLCDYIKKKYPGIPIIIDAKRGDIGHTNAHYAKYVFEYLGADGVTLQPYLGSEALSEFFAYENKGLIILCRTSNPGAGEFQDLLVKSDNKKTVPMWEKIAMAVTQNWQKKSRSELLLVIGATYPDELKKIRKIAPQTTFLVPGVGSQGGDLEKTIKFGCNQNGQGIIINSSRGIIFAKNPKLAIKQMWKNHIKML
jgi:orotidine-5'-phosphate decarboxylase